MEALLLALDVLAMILLARGARRALAGRRDADLGLFAYKGGAADEAASHPESGR